MNKVPQGISRQPPMNIRILEALSIIDDAVKNSANVLGTQA